jgi:hypothetical protein
VSEKSLIAGWRVPPEFRVRLEACLSVNYEWAWLEADSEATALLRGEKPIVALILEQPFDSTGRDLLREAHLNHPDLPIAFLARTTEAPIYTNLQTYAVGAALPASPDLSDRQLDLFFKHLIEPNQRGGLSDYFQPGHPIKRYRVTDQARRNEILETVSSDFDGTVPVDSYDLQLVFEEILNNALIHAFRTTRSHPKYGAASRTLLDSEDEVCIEWTTCSNLQDAAQSHGALAISDNQGLLAPHVAWERFFRQTSLKGLLDTNGRGLYLVHLLSSLMLINIWPGKRTEILAFFDPVPQGTDRPISIRVHRHADAALEFNE